MCILAIIQFVRQSLQMYRVTKQWQLSKYMNLLVKQGIFYFFVYVLVSSFPSSAIYARKMTNRANDNLALQNLSVCLRQYVEYVGIFSPTRMGAVSGVLPAICTRVHSIPSVHLEYPGVVCS